MKERIEYIDLAKGICILLVVLDHIAGYRYFSDGNYPMNDIFEQTRMPLYLSFPDCSSRTTAAFASFCCARRTASSCLTFSF